MSFLQTFDGYGPVVPSLPVRYPHRDRQSQSYRQRNLPHDKLCRWTYVAGTILAAGGKLCWHSEASIVHTGDIRGVTPARSPPRSSTAGNRWVRSRRSGTGPALYGLQAQPEPQCAVEFPLIGSGKTTKSPVDARVVQRKQSALDDTRKQQSGSFPLN